MADSKKRNVQKNILTWVIIAGCLAMLIHGSWNLIRALNNYRLADELYSRTAEEFVSEADESPETVQPVEDKDTANPEKDDKNGERTTTGTQKKEERKSKTSSRPASVNFKKLREINSDVIGWIYIGGANVSYPIVKGSDNDYYLHRDYRGKYLFAGSIFADYRDSSDFSDLNTVIYGHNMKNGSMFGRLSNLKRKNVVERDRYIWIYTPEGTYCYEISAVFQTESTSYVYTIFKRHGKDYENWVKKINRHTLSGLNPLSSGEGSRCLTLSTCTGSLNKRTVVIAGLVTDQT